jgi:hypothetical protein
MPPKKKATHNLQREANHLEFHTEGPSQAGRAMDHNATNDTILTHHIPQMTNSNTTTEARATAAVTTNAYMGGSKGLSELQMVQDEAFATDTIDAYLIPNSSKQAPLSSQIKQDFDPEIKDLDDQQLDSEEENKTAIAEELAYLRQQNEHLRLE